MSEPKYTIYSRKIKQFKGGCKSTWKQMNNIFRPNRINKRNIMNQINKNIIYETEHDIADVLNSYFENI